METRNLKEMNTNELGSLLKTSIDIKLIYKALTFLAQKDDVLFDQVVEQCQDKNSDFGKIFNESENEHYLLKLLNLKIKMLQPTPTQSYIDSAKEAYCARAEFYINKSDCNGLDLEKAIEDFTQAIKIDRHCGEIYLQRAGIYRIQNKLTEEKYDLAQAGILLSHGKFADLNNLTHPIEIINKIKSYSTKEDREILCLLCLNPETVLGKKFVKLVDGKNYLADILKIHPKLIIWDSTFNRSVCYLRALTFFEAGNIEASLFYLNLLDNYNDNTYLLNNNWKYSNYLKVYFLRGKVFAKLNKYTKAINDFNSILNAIKPIENFTCKFSSTEEANIFIADIHYHLGNAYCHTNNLSLAIDHYKQATSLNPDYINAYINCGIAYNKSKQYNLAISNFEKAKSLGSENVGVHYNLGLAYRKINNYEMAFNNIQIALSLNPDHELANNFLKDKEDGVGKYYESNTQYLKGMDYKQASRFTEAVNHFTQAIKAFKKNRYYFERAEAYFQLKKYESAFKDYMMIINEPYGKSALKEKFADIYEDINVLNKISTQDIINIINIYNPGHGIKFFELCLNQQTALGKRFSKDKDNLNLIKKTLDLIKKTLAPEGRSLPEDNIDQKTPQQLIEHYTELLDIYKKQIPYFINEEIKKKSSGFTISWRAHNDSTHKMEQNYNETLVKRAEVYLKENKAKEALADLLAAKTLIPTPLFPEKSSEEEKKAWETRILEFNFNQKLQLGHAYSKNKEWNNAIFAYQEVLKLDDKHILAHTNLAICYYNIGDVNKALDANNEVIKLSPQRANAYFNRGQVYKGMFNTETNKFKEALIDLIISANLSNDKSHYDKTCKIIHEILKTKSLEIDGMIYTDLTSKFSMFLKEINPADFYIATKNLSETDTKNFINKCVDHLSALNKQYHAEKISIVGSPVIKKAEDYFNNGKKLSEKGSLDQAIINLKQAIELSRNENNTKILNASIEVLSSIGHGYILKSKFQVAKDILEYVIHKQAYRPAYINLGVCFAELRQLQNAIKYFTLGINLDPNCVIGYYDRGLVYLRLAQYNDAMIDFVTTYTKDNTYFKALQEITTLLNADLEILEKITVESLQAAISSLPEEKKKTFNDDIQNPKTNLGKRFGAKNTATISTSEFATFAEHPEQTTEVTPIPESIKPKVFDLHNDL